MYETPRAWPLQWPAGYPRTPVNQRRIGKFTNHRKPLTIAASIARLQHQVDLLGGNSTVLSSNVETRLDGLPRSDARMPEDPGVCVYFHLKGRPTAMPCDAYRAVADNIAAIAAHIDAVRSIGRYGVGSVEQMFTGFQAIRGPGPKPWREVLGIRSDNTQLTAKFIRERRQELARRHHPDTGGDPRLMAEINDAADLALAEILQ